MLQNNEELPLALKVQTLNHYIFLSVLQWTLPKVCSREDVVSCVCGQDNTHSQNSRGRAVTRLLKWICHYRPAPRCWAQQLAGWCVCQTCFVCGWMAGPWLYARPPAGIYRFLRKKMCSLGFPGAARAVRMKLCALTTHLKAARTQRRIRRLKAVTRLVKEKFVRSSFLAFWQFRTEW